VIETAISPIFLGWARVGLFEARPSPAVRHTGMTPVPTLALIPLESPSPGGEALAPGPWRARALLPERLAPPAGAFGAAPGGTARAPGEAIPAVTRAQKRPSDVAREIELAHRKLRCKRPDFASQKEREAHDASTQVAALVPLLPKAVVLKMLGGEQGLRQVPLRAMRDAMLERMLLTRAGTDGARLANVRSLLKTARTYAAETLKLDEAARDDAIFPMSAALAHQLVAAEDARALREGHASVGPRLRDTIIFAAERLGWPIDPDRILLEPAAPPATARARSKAGALPSAAKCQLELVAASGLRGIDGLELSEAALAACEHYARSFLCTCVDHSIRVAEGVRTELIPDEEAPAHVIRGHSYLTKDGAASDIFAPAEGFLGAYEWFTDHLRVVARPSSVDPGRLGTFPKRWVKPRGSAGDIRRASGWTGGGATEVKANVRKALLAILQLPPFGATVAELKAWNITGHSAHATMPEWARCLTAATAGSPAEKTSAELGLTTKFDDHERDALGHWLRDEGARGEATATEAAMAAPAELARRAAAVAALPGRRATKGAMRVYYGQAGANGARISERLTQLAVRQRIPHLMRGILREKPWQELPRCPKGDIASLVTSA